MGLKVLLSISLILCLTPLVGAGDTGTAEPQVRVRPAALAGSWYRAAPEELASDIDAYLGKTSKDLAGYPMALIVPHAGPRFSGAVAGQAYELLKGRSYGRVFILGPAHREAFSGIALPVDNWFETPLGRIPVAWDVVQALASQPLFQPNGEAHSREHSIEIQLPFLQRVLPRFELVPLLVGGLTREEVRVAAETLRGVVGPGDLVIASSDFTHYGERFGYFGPPEQPIGLLEASGRLRELLEQAWGFIAARDVEGFFSYKVRTRDTICGFLPIALLLSLLPEETSLELLAMDTSGAMESDWSNSVSYLSAAALGFWPYEGGAGPGRLTPDEKEQLLKLARTVVETWVRDARRVTPEDAGVRVTETMMRPSGGFVTLKKHGQLRGCIGNILPVKSLLESVMDNGVNAASFDSRFKPVAAGELEDLELEISVLTPLREVEGPQDLVLGRDGILISKGGRSAVFLPQVAVEQGWTVAQTLNHLARKAGLPEDGWKQGTRFQVFEATVFHEQ